MIKGRALFILFFVYFSRMIIGDVWIELKNYLSKVKIKEIEIQFNPKFPINAKEADSENILGEFKYKLLNKYFKRYKFIQYPYIEKKLEFEKIKKYDFFWIKDYGVDAYGKCPFTVAIPAEGKKIRRLGYYNAGWEWYIESTTLMFYEIRVCDIIFFNEMIKKENVQVNGDEKLALDICMFFLKLADDVDFTVVQNKKEIEEVFTKEYGDRKDHELAKLKKPIHPPFFKLNENGSMELLFITEAIFIREWNFLVKKNGEILLLNCERIFL